MLFCSLLILLLNCVHCTLAAPYSHVILNLSNIFVFNLVFTYPDRNYTWFFSVTP